jgi:hypothetical protein
LPAASIAVTQIAYRPGRRRFGRRMRVAPSAAVRRLVLRFWVPVRTMVTLAFPLRRKLMMPRRTRSRVTLGAVRSAAVVPGGVPGVGFGTTRAGSVEGPGSAGAGSGPGTGDAGTQRTEGALERVDWNAELVLGDLGDAIRTLKQAPGRGLSVGGVKLPMALAELGLIDEYEFVVHHRLAGHGPTLFEGLSKHIDLRLVDQLALDSGAVAMRYAPSG